MKKTLQLIRSTARNICSFVLPGIIIATFALLVVYLYEMNRPIPLADIKVPVATDKASYYPGQEVSGIFFGKTFFDGEVKILREVFCSQYKGLIKPPAEAASGNYYDTQGKPRTLEGQTLYIGTIPQDVPIGSNCVIQFTNVYTIDTHFGDRNEKYQYYTQNFAIVTKQRRDLLDCEARGGTDCSMSENTTVNNYTYQTPAQQAPTPAIPNKTTLEPSEPVTPPEVCTLGLLGLCIVR